MVDSHALNQCIIIITEDILHRILTHFKFGSDGFTSLMSFSSNVGLFRPTKQSKNESNDALQTEICDSWRHQKEMDGMCMNNRLVLIQ